MVRTRKLTIFRLISGADKRPSKMDVYHNIEEHSKISGTRSAPIFWYETPTQNAFWSVSGNCFIQNARAHTCTCGIVIILVVNDCSQAFSNKSPIDCGVEKHLFGRSRMGCENSSGNKMTVRTDI